MPLTISEPSNLDWHKALQSSADGACVEVARSPGTVFVRDSRDKAGPMLCFDVAAWQIFLVCAKDNNFDVSKLEPCIAFAVPW